MGVLEVVVEYRFRDGNVVSRGVGRLGVKGGAGGGGGRGGPLVRRVGASVVGAVSLSSLSLSLSFSLFLLLSRGPGDFVLGPSVEGVVDELGRDGRVLGSGGKGDAQSGSVMSYSEVNPEVLKASVYVAGDGPPNKLSEAVGGLGVMAEVGGEVGVKGLAVDVAGGAVVGRGVGEVDGVVCRARLPRRE